MSAYPITNTICIRVGWQADHVSTLCTALGLVLKHILKPLSTRSNCFGNHCSHMAKQSEQRENCSGVWNNFSHPSRCEKCICSTVRRRWETHCSALRRTDWLEAHLTTFIKMNVSQLQTFFIYGFDHWHRILYITMTLHWEVGPGNVSMRYMRNTVKNIAIIWIGCVFLRRFQNIFYHHTAQIYSNIVLMPYPPALFWVGLVVSFLFISYSTIKENVALYPILTEQNIKKTTFYGQHKRLI